MKLRLHSLLLAGVVAGSMIACSKDLPSGPAHDDEGLETGSGAAAKLRPVNDDFNDALVISALPFTHRVSTIDARTSHDDPLNDETCGFGSIGGHTVWYQFTPSENIRVNASTSGSSFDPNVFVYTGTQGDLTRVTCNFLPRSATFDAVAGQTYFFLVGSSGAEPGGNLVFTVSASIEVGVTIDPVGTIDPSTGVVTITGTVTCSSSAFFELGAAVQQGNAQASQGSLFDAGSCSGVSPWRGEVQAENGRFVPGTVEVSADALFTANATTEERHGTAEPTTVRLVVKN
jgi:hypothetical protein